MDNEISKGKEFVDIAEFDGEYPDTNSVFMAELDGALRRKLAGTPWVSRIEQLDKPHSWEERVAFYQDLRKENVLPNEATYFLIAWAIEALAQERVDHVYDTVYAKRFESIRKAHGLRDNEEWEPGKGPKEYEALDKEFSQAVDAISRSTYQRFGEHKMADLLEKNPDEANRLYEAGHDYIDNLIDEDILAHVREDS
ncbi:MAG TPA: hypothetical protein VHV83_00845 [Armatimonadota bacterium]|jgi:hypothetical protein|nr:hypothetical protein [Armatimonadota bacterium]